MSSNKQSGFSAIISIIIIVLVVGIAGFIGWRLYSQSQSSKKVSDSTSTPSTSSQPNKETPTGTNAATITPQGTYIDIKEMGIKITLDSSISDAVYAPVSTTPTDGSKVMGISTKSLINTPGSNSMCSAANGALGIIRETTSQPTSISGPVAVDNKTVFKINNNYYQYVRPQNDACATGDVTPDMIETKVSAFTRDFATTQPDNQ